MRRIHIKGYRLKGGKLVKDQRHLDVSARLRQKGSKKVRVATRAKAAQVGLPRFGGPKE